MRVHVVARMIHAWRYQRATIEFSSYVFMLCEISLSKNKIASNCIEMLKITVADNTNVNQEILRSSHCPFIIQGLKVD